MLELKGISKSFHGPEGEAQALDGIALSVSSGEFVAVRGPSGCGKTTLLLIAGGLLRPSEGEVMIDGQDPYGLDANQRSTLRAEKIGFVFQQFHLVPYLTVLDNVLTPVVPRPRPDAMHRAWELICHFGLERRARYVPSQLSTGECQRAALARALLNHPKIILADEPTGNLDEKNSEVVFGYLTEFAKNDGSVLVVTHDARAAEYADRMLPMDAGRLLSS